LPELVVVVAKGLELTAVGVAVVLEVIEPT
jgi:hypothetical protein